MYIGCVSYVKEESRSWDCFFLLLTEKRSCVLCGEGVGGVVIIVVK